MIYRQRFRHLYDVERTRIRTDPAIKYRLNRLERVDQVVQELHTAVWGTVPADLLQQYPDYVPFYDRLAEHVGVPKQRIVVGAGIEEFVKTLYLLCCDPGDRVVILWPTCAMFEVYAKVFGIDLIRVVTDPGSPPEFETVRTAATTDRVRLVLLANPGQPVETCYSPDELRVIAAECRRRDVVLAIDEAYHGFGAPTALPLVDEFDNVLVLRTFSKAFGAASIRLGYAVGQERVIKPLDAIRSSGETSGPSMHAAARLIEEYDWFVAPAIEQVCQGRDWLRDAVREGLGLDAWGRTANHVLIDLIDRCCRDAVVDRLAARGFAVKGNYSAPLDHHILVTCASRPVMEKFFTALSDSLQG